MRARLRFNHTTGIPRHHIVIDTETVPVADPDWPALHVHRLRLGVARYFRFEDDKVMSPQELVFYDRNTILNWILDKTSPNSPVWLWAHNAAFDLTAIGFWMLFESGELSLKWSDPEGKISPVTGLPVKPREGLLVTEDPPTIIRAYTKSGATLWAIDSLNWCMASLRDLGDAVGVEKLDMPGEQAEDSDWLAYCRRDAEILERLVVSILRFVKVADLGNFRATAASQAYAFFRHRCMTCAIDVDDDLDVKAMERQCYYGGRREVYFQGCVVRSEAAGIEHLAGAPVGMPVIAKGPVYHLDLTGAYPSVMADNVFPVRKLGEEFDVDPEILLAKLKALGAAAHVRISCGNGSWPVRRGEKVISAMGDFDTYLCGPELIRAIRERAVSKVYHVRYYAVDKPFAKFVQEGWKLRQDFHDCGQFLFARIAKVLLNALHGKFAQRANRWEMVPGAMAPTAWGHYTTWDARSGQMRVFRSVGGNVQLRLDGGEREDSFPLIAAYATAYCRELMHRLRWVAGLREVLYEDADSMHVTQSGFNALRDAGWVDEGKLGKLHVVRKAERSIYYGPKDYVLDEYRVMAGVARRAVEDGRGMWHQTNFHRLDSLLASTPPEGPVCADVVKQTPRPVTAARVMADGWTEPLKLADYKGVK